MAEEISVVIPKELENMKLPSPELVSYYRDFNDRRIYINYEIDDTLIEVSRQILQYNIEDKGIPVEERKKIYLYIYSYGGDLPAAYSLIAICEASTTPIVTINMGVAMSAGLLIFLAGHERYCLRRSTALIHSGSANGVSGTFEQMQESQKAYEVMVKDMKEYILDKTTISEKVFNRNKSKDWYLTDTQQQEYNIAHKIVTSLEEII